MRAPFTAILFRVGTDARHQRAAAAAGGRHAGARHHGAAAEALHPDGKGGAPRISHLTREYATDPLEILFVREVMRTKLVALPAEATVEDLRQTCFANRRSRGQHLYPVVDDAKGLRAWSRASNCERSHREPPDRRASLGDICASRWWRIRTSRCAWWFSAWRRLASRGCRWWIGERRTGRHGFAARSASARVRNLEEERKRERVLKCGCPL